MSVSRLSVLSAMPAVTFPASERHRPWPVALVNRVLTDIAMPDIGTAGIELVNSRSLSNFLPVDCKIAPHKKCKATTRYYVTVTNLVV